MFASRSSFPRRPHRVALTVAAAAALPFALVAPAAAGGHGGPGSGSGSGSGSTTTTGWSVVSQTLQQPYSWQDPALFGVDDFLHYTVSGQIAPGATVTYTPPWPTSRNSEIPAASAFVSWSGATSLRVSTVVPMNDSVAGADPGVNHIGQQVVAPVVGNSAQLCMFFDGGWQGAPSSWNYTISITNVGTQSATGVTLTGQESNGYTSNYHALCNHADANGDGWNDTLEHGMFDLTYPWANDQTTRLGVLGTDYLQAAPRSTTPDDEIDAYPTDLNDDGIVDAQDVAAEQSHVGEGTGVPLDMVDYSNTTANTYNQQSGLWRRYDLDGDGRVTANDVAWVQAGVGRPLPDPADLIAPHVVISHAFTPTSTAPKSVVWLGASARDNRYLTSVTWSVNGTQLTSGQCTNPMTEGANQAAYPVYNTPEYVCPWTAPSRSGPVTVKVVATDASGNTSSDSMTVTVG